jgi:DNA polymerase-3 subunit delta
MKVKPEQLAANLSQRSYPLYLISGDEPLLVEESCDILRQHYKALGYTERIVFHIEAGFNWQEFLNALNNDSLFAAKALVELRLKGKLPETGGKIIQRYSETPIANNVLLVIADKIDSTQQKSSWFKAIDTHGVIVQIWPLEPSRFQSWLIHRLKKAGLTVDSQGIQLLTELLAGNLLAATQEITKLAILYGKGEILSYEQIAQSITDNAKFDTMRLMAASLAGDIKLVNRIFASLKKELVEPVILLWQITNELRTLIKIKIAVNQGMNIDGVITANRIFYSRKIAVKKVVAQCSLNSLYHLLHRTSEIELILKGAKNFPPLWHELQKLYWSFSSNK